MKKSMKRFLIFFSIVSILAGWIIGFKIQNAGNAWYAVAIKCCGIGMLILLVVSSIRILVFYRRYRSNMFCIRVSRFNNMIEYYIRPFSLWTIGWIISIVYSFNFIIGICVLYFIWNLYDEMYTDIIIEFQKWITERY